jgi:hypothetical protein
MGRALRLRKLAHRSYVSEQARQVLAVSSLGSTTDLRVNGDDSFGSFGVIDQADYIVWKTNFGQHAGGGSRASAAVPEPGTLLLLLLGTVAVRFRRCAAWS